MSTPVVPPDSYGTFTEPYIPPSISTFSDTVVSTTIGSSKTSNILSTSSSSLKVAPSETSTLSSSTKSAAYPTSSSSSYYTSLLPWSSIYSSPSHTVSSSLATHSNSTSSPSASTSSISNNSGPFVYVQLDGTRPVSYPASYVDRADFSSLCSGKDCYSACQNASLVYDSDSFAIGSAAANVSSADNGLTLFGICSNLANLTSAVASGSLPSAASYFPQAELKINDTSIDGGNLVDKITLDMAVCMYGTCEVTRDPTQCVNHCWTDILLESTNTLDIGRVQDCLNRLCSNTCGLPDANQDVFGIGLVISYVMQVLIVLGMAIILSVYTFHRLLQSPGESFQISDHWLETLHAFLLAEGFFGLTSTIASFFLKPGIINPLDGYALLAVAITGFLPTTLTFLFLRLHGKHKTSSIVMTVLSYILSSILFWMLWWNLRTTKDSPMRMAEARNSLFKVDACGGFSAMSLCQENVNNDPLKYLEWFYNYHLVPNILTVPVVWAWSTIMLVGTAVPLKEVEHSSRGALWTRFMLMVTALVASVFMFVYQGKMVWSYYKMDVINIYGWTFGQVVAVTFWLPSLVAFAPVAGKWIKEKLPKKYQAWFEHSGKKAGSSGHAGGIALKPYRKSASSSVYQPLAHSPMPSPQVGQGFSHSTAVSGSTGRYEPVRSPGPYQGYQMSPDHGSVPVRHWP